MFIHSILKICIRRGDADFWFDFRKLDRHTDLPDTLIKLLSFISGSDNIEIVDVESNLNLKRMLVGKHSIKNVAGFLTSIIEIERNNFDRCYALLHLNYISILGSFHDSNFVHDYSVVSGRNLRLLINGLIYFDDRSSSGELSKFVLEELARSHDKEFASILLDGAFTNGTRLPDRLLAATLLGMYGELFVSDFENASETHNSSSGTFNTPTLFNIMLDIIYRVRYHPNGKDHEPVYSIYCDYPDEYKAYGLITNMADLLLKSPGKFKQTLVEVYKSANLTTRLLIIYNAFWQSVYYNNPDRNDPAYLEAIIDTRKLLDIIIKNVKNIVFLTDVERFDALRFDAPPQTISMLILNFAEIARRSGANI